MIIINDNDYSNPYDKSNDNKTKVKEWITKIIKVLLARVVIKTIIIIKIIKLLTMIIITVIIIIIYKILRKWCKIGSGEMQYSMYKKILKKTKLKC